MSEAAGEPARTGWTSRLVGEARAGSTERWAASWRGAGPTCS
jgi:hypothetical protein